MSEFKPTTKVINEFALLCLNPEIKQAEEFVQNLLRNGESTESIYLNLFTPSARYLGTLWEDDECDFVQVTIGLMQLQIIIRKLGQTFQGNHDAGDLTQKALFAPMPGSQHILGVLMVSEFFRKEGWQVWLELGASEANLLDMLSTEWFDLVGLSVGTQAQLDQLTGLIARIRKAALNPALFVMLGGPAIYGRSDLLDKLGADAIVSDARSAVELAQELRSLIV
jgi:methanogenic corrinoid protein MtbC1